MTNKELYREFCKKNHHLPIFMQDWWLDAVCAGKEWDVMLCVKRGDEEMRLLGEAVNVGEVLLVFIALLNTIISLYYYLLVVKAMFIKKSDAPIAYFKSDCMTRVGLLICTVCIIALGFFSPIYEYINGISFGM